MEKKKPICDFCGEYTKCICVWEKCALCHETYSNYDPDDSHQIFEYRGFLGCTDCIKEVRKQVDAKRQEVMEVTNHSISSQRKGEFVNNRGKYHLGNVSKVDGLPIMKVKEPQILKDYENGIL